ncbi:MAG: hypothetical protein ACLFVQ_09905 [Chitinispirillaceae bacterium]
MEKAYDYREEKNTSSAKAYAEDIRENAQAKTEELAHSGKDVAVKEMGNIGNALHSATDKLHEENDFLADFADVVVGKFDQMGEYMKNHSSREMVTDLNEYSKKNPYVAVGGLFLAGLALSRFIKAGK